MLHYKIQPTLKVKDCFYGVKWAFDVQTGMTPEKALVWKGHSFMQNKLHDQDMARWDEVLWITVGLLTGNFSGGQDSAFW